MPKADVSEERIVISECGQRSTDWWNTLLDKLKAHHIPGRYQHGKRRWADSVGWVAVRRPTLLTTAKARDSNRLRTSPSAG